jgi:hypothetical protein
LLTDRFHFSSSDKFSSFFSFGLLIILNNK